MSVKYGTFRTSPIYNGEYKIGKIYKGLDLYYQSFVYDPVVALIERTIEKVDAELTNETKSIGSGAFMGCEYLNSLTIPSSVTNINANAISGCPNLTSVTILATTPPTLENVNAFSDETTIIYVPSSSVSAYQTAQTWRDLTTRETNPITFVGI